VHPEIGEGSFDLVLQRLLDRKRELSESVLVPFHIDAEDREGFFREIISSTGHGAASPQPAGVDLRAVDALSPRQFEDWVADRLLARGYQVNRTPISGDAGVDLVASPINGSGPARLVQCKHTTTGNPCGALAVREIADGANRYETLGGSQLLVVTNAPGFTGQAIDLAGQLDIQLVDRNGLRGL